MKRIALLVLTGLLLTACSGPLFSPTPLPGLPAGTLTPYYTLTPSPTSPAKTPIPVSPSPTLSPTPFIHKVSPGEVFSAIAARYGLTYDELRAANPDVFLSPMLVGTLLIIPGQGFTPTPPPPTPTPLPLQAGAPACLADASGGAWCFLMVHNPLEESLENVSARLEITNPAGELLAVVTVSGLLNLLPGGASLPLAAYVPQVSAPLQVRLLDLQALPVPPADTRYLSAHLEDISIQIASDGLSASIQGQILLAGETPASLVWAALTAYDATGNVVGARRWESPAGLQPGSAGLLDGRVYSAGGKIERVEVLLEARP